VDPRTLYTSDELSWLARPDRAVEGPFVEPKEIWKKDAVAKAVCGMANGQAPGGLVVVGVASDGSIPGLGESRALVHREIGQLPVEGVRHEVRFVEAGDGKEVLFIWVAFSHDRVARLTNGTAFQRRGSSTQELAPDEIEELRYQRGEKDYETSPIAPYGVELLDPAVVAAFMKGVVELNGLRLPATVEEALTNKGLTTRLGDGVHLTVAAVLALGKRPADFIPGARLHLSRFDGTEERVGAVRNVTKERWFDGSLAVVLDEVRAFMRTLIREFDYLGPDGRFVTEPEYPEVVWEEAIVNALVHRSYSIRSTPVRVRIFDDRLEVESPGGFPPLARPNEEGIFPQSAPRNARLAEALRYLRITRLAREGTRRMRTEMIDLGLPPPEFVEVDRVKVLVTLRNDVARRRARPGSAPHAERWTEVARLIGEGYAIQRRKGWDEWARLISEGGSPSLEVIAAAKARVMSADLNTSEKKVVLGLLTKVPPGGAAALAVEWASFLEGLARSLRVPSDARMDAEAETLVARLIARVPGAIDRVLALLEGDSVGDDAMELAFRCLWTRVTDEPLPPRAWLDRVVAVCRKHPAFGRDTYQHVTGDVLP
jgi:ATP-dependent DNA helicase RecG